MTKSLTPSTITLAGTSSKEAEGLRDFIVESRAYTEAAHSDGPKCCQENSQMFLFPSREPSNPIGTRSNTCPSHRYCAAEGLIVPKGLVSGPFQSPRPLDFTAKRFIPLVNPLDRRTFAHLLKPSYFATIAVQAWPLMIQPAAFRRVVSRGLADTLDFDGKTILSSVMPDGLIISRGIDEFIGVVRALNPSAALTWDVPTYVNHPRKSAFCWVMEGLDGARKMAESLDIPLIGLVSGASMEQVRFSSECLEKLGFSDQAIAGREYVRAKQTPFLQACVEALATHAKSIMLLSCSSPRLFAKFPKVDYFAGMSWFNRAYRGLHASRQARGCKHFGGSSFEQLSTENLEDIITSQSNFEHTLEEAFGIG